jgi:hypothetical protein
MSAQTNVLLPDVGFSKLCPKVGLKEAAKTPNAI